MPLRKQLTLPGVIFCFLAGTGHVFAQAQVVDAASDQSRSNQNTGNTQSANSQNDIMVQMYLQLEALQNEIQNLRGMVEEQSYQIQRLQTEQRDRYLDTDSRLSELFSYHSGQQPPARQPSTGTPNEQPAATGGPGSLLPGSPLNTAGNDIGNIGTTTTASTAPRNEQELYREALDLLLEEENFQESANLFQEYIDAYPQGRYLTNALYWQGAALHLLGNLPQSIAVLQRLLEEFPQDPKAPTAMLRLGTVYSEMGNRARAVEYWSRISRDYPGSTSEIELASDYLNAAGP